LALSNEIGEKIKELDKRDWDFKMKVHNDDVATEKQRINAYRDVGVDGMGVYERKLIKQPVGLIGLSVNSNGTTYKHR